jgi:hypothetical protein
MLRKAGTCLVLCVVVLCLTAVWCSWRPRPAETAEPLGETVQALREATVLLAAAPAADPLERHLNSQVLPFLQRYCHSCHGAKKQKAALDLSRDTTVGAFAANARRWEQVRLRLEAHEMPPEDARQRPAEKERAAVVAWITELCDREAERSAGDPGTVLARRLSNAELDNTIRDLTGVDIRPTREFPVDPANEAGFDNSGESLAMSPALLKKYLAMARRVADHVVLKPDGFVFAPHPAVTETDRDKYCVSRIVDFYRRHQVDHADYFLAAWRHRWRDRLGRPGVDLAARAREAGLSARYLALVWSALAEEAEAGPMAAVRKLWRDLPAPGSAGAINEPRAACERIRDLVVRLRKQLEPEVPRLSVRGISNGSQPLVLWRNRQLADRHRKYEGKVPADLRKLAGQLDGASDALAGLFQLGEGPTRSEHAMRKALEHFCEVFPRAFVVVDRGPYFDPKAAGQGRLLTAGFHLMQGYFRDDGPLCELILDQPGRRELEALWHELNFVTLAPLRQYKDFIFFERAEPPRFMIDAQFDFARSEDKAAVSEEKMKRLAGLYLGKARKQGAGTEAVKAIEDYFTGMSAEIRRVERARLAAEPGHLRALVQFTERAYRRPLTTPERDDVLAFYHALRRKDGLGHEEALRDALATVLLSPHFCYRCDLPLGKLPTPAKAVGVKDRPWQPLSPYQLASRLSYFLWASMPDEELLARAAAGDLAQPKVLKAQVRRMLCDPRVRGLAAEFAGNLLDFRRFEEHNSVDRERFPSFTNELRQAMFEEPIHFFIDVARRNRSILDLLYAKDTFVNRTLARHYGIAWPVAGVKGEGSTWAHVPDADRNGRGGLLPMAVFLTRNAPGLRTSPVKRGYWVVRRLLGEEIPPPPPTVPELPKDEAKLGELTLPQVLARHREDRSCAGCHRRFDSVGLAFEGYGPIGERRTKDLGGRPVQTRATFPDGKERDALAGLRHYLHEQRERDYVENLCRKLLSYALGRGLLLSDRKALEAMRRRLEAEGYAFDSLVESVVTSSQFLNKRISGDTQNR